LAGRATGAGGGKTKVFKHFFSLDNLLVIFQKQQTNSPKIGYFVYNFSYMFKKSILLISCALLISGANAQAIFDDFEGNGNISTWTGDDCGINTSLANPVQQGINTSSTVLEYTDAGGRYANIRFDVASPLDLSNDASFSFKIYIPSSGITGNSPNQVSLKLQDGRRAEPWGTQTEIVKPILLDQWQTVSFDFLSDPYINLDPGSPAPIARDDLNRILIQVNGEDNNDHVTAYIDDFSYEDKADEWPVYDRLVWADECDGNGVIDTTKWFHQTQLPNGFSWYNGEIQHYTDRIENAFRQDGNMHIVAKKEQFSDQGHTKDYTSARLNSKFAFTYGRVEARAKLPLGGGTWPAIWMLGKNIDEPGAYWASRFGTVGWPACGEIDIMEHWGDNQNYVSAALHTPSSFGATVNVGGITDPDVSDEFHTYAVDWTPTRMRFSIDNQVYYVYDPEVRNADTWPFDDEMYIILNIAIEGDVDPAFNESDLVFDYIRVYQESATFVGRENPLEQLKVFPNPTEGLISVTFPEGVQILEASLFTTEGKLVKQARLDRSNASMDCRGLNPGLYEMKLENKGQVVVRKVVIQ
jgi:beta-glucanase (GH16 family)